MDSFCLRCGKFIENHEGICKDCQNIVTLFKIPFLDNTSNKFYNIKSESKCRSSRYMQVLPYWVELSQIGRLSDNKIIELVHSNGFDKDGLSLEIVKEDIAYFAANTKGKNCNIDNICNVAQLKRWDVIYFGNSWDGNVSSWLVLSKDENRVELIALEYQDIKFLREITDGKIQADFSMNNFRYEGMDKFKVIYAGLPKEKEINSINKYLNDKLFYDCWLQDNELKYRYINNDGDIMPEAYNIYFRKARLFPVLMMEISGDAFVEYRGSLKQVYKKDKL